MASNLYEEVAVQDRSDLNQAMNVDASVSAKGLWGGASGSASYFKSVKMSADAFYWLVHADYRLKDTGIDTGDIELTEAAKRVLQGPGGLPAFYEACGEYFYSGSQQGAHYALLYEFKSTEEKTVERIKAAASYEGFGVEAKASFEKFAEMAMRSSVLKVHAASAGGSERLKSYATNPQQLEEELTKLREDLYRNGTGVETQWFMSDYNMFPEVQEARAKAQAAGAPAPVEVPKLYKDFALANLYKRFTDNVSASQRAATHLSRASGVEPLYAYNSEKRERIEEAIREIDRENQAIANRAKECMVGGAESCSTSDVFGNRPWEGGDLDKWLAPDENYTTLQGWTLALEPDGNTGARMRFVGMPPDKAHRLTFPAGRTIMKSAIGILARADEGPDFATVVGTPEVVRDPVGGQQRPNVCVYNFQDICSLRVVPLPGKREDGGPLVKLQMVLFDDYGFVQKRLDYPTVD
jgi:hypothetical protein